MTEFTEQSYMSGVTVELDGNIFKRCIFDGCRMHFSGGPVPTFDDCIIKNVVWAFGGAAGRGIEFLSALYNHFGAPGRRDAEEMIRNIKSGKRRTR
jgi:hypothetical protein